MPSSTHVRLSPLEVTAIENHLAAGTDEALAMAKELVQSLAAAYGLPPLPGGATYGVDLDLAELLAP